MLLCLYELARVHIVILVSHIPIHDTLELLTIDTAQLLLLGQMVVLRLEESKSLVYLPRELAHHAGLKLFPDSLAGLFVCFHQVIEHHQPLVVVGLVVVFIAAVG